MFSSRTSQGFSLIELILVVVLISILAVVSLPMLVSGIDAFSQQRETTAIEREAMLALDRISREVRMSRNFAFNGSSISFERDGETITISQDAGSLVLERGGNTSVLAENVSNVSFSGESYEDVCYILARFDTAGIADTWRSVTYARNDSC